MPEEEREGGRGGEGGRRERGGGTGCRLLGGVRGRGREIGGRRLAADARHGAMLRKVKRFGWQRVCWFELNYRCQAFYFYYYYYYYYEYYYYCYDSY